MTTLPEALRAAADLVEQLDYQRGCTWRGTNTLDLHGVTGIELLRLTSLGATLTDSGVLVLGDEECDCNELAMPSGLKVTAFGPHRAHIGEAA